MSSLLEDYAEAFSTPEDDYLHRLFRATHTHLLYPRMASGHMQGLLLRMLCRMMKPKNVLEIGTFSGYSALAMASGMEKGSRIVTYEINDEQEVFTRPWLEGNPYPATIEMRIGDVAEHLPQTDETFDMAYVDGNKRDYIRYYELVMPRLRCGGILIADNTLWNGHVTDPVYAKDAQTKAIHAFNTHVKDDNRVEQVILTDRDGLTLIYKKP